MQPIDYNDDIITWLPTFSEEKTSSVYDCTVEDVE